jgi:proline iminopeptidase
MSSVEPMPPRPTEGNEAQVAALRAVSIATLEHHYMSRVLPHEGDVLEQVDRIAHLPCEIVHGRYDIVCPIRQAWELTKAWPGAVLHVANQSGHWTFATQTAALLTAAAARLRLRI